MMHIAVFDALNSIDYQYTPYVTAVNVPQGASRDAAAAQAAHDVLVALMPTLTATFDAASRPTSSRIDRRRRPQAAAVARGRARGPGSARRRRMGSTRVAYIPATLPGYWQPTPPANAPPRFVHYQDVAGIHPSQRALPAGRSATGHDQHRYARDFNEVKTIGSATSSTRSAEETTIANTWASVGNITNPISAWNSAMQDLTRSRNLNGLDAARMFALGNMAMHDGLWITFTGKFNYGLWRPVTAIREAAGTAMPPLKPIQTGCRCWSRHPTRVIPAT